MSKPQPTSNGRDEGIRSKNHALNPQFDRSRRDSFSFAAFAAFLIATPTGIKDSLDLSERWKLKRRLSTVLEVVEGRFDEEKAERVRRLLFPQNGTFDLVPAMNHPVWSHPPNRTYPNEEHALQSIMRLFPGRAKEVADHPFKVETGHSPVFLGASISNKHTALVLGERDRPKFHFSGPGFRAEFQYSIRSIEEQFVTRLQDDNPDWRVPNNAIVDRSGKVIAVPEFDDKRKLRTDYLLVSRIPRELGGSDQLIFSPTHGPGMRAVEKLLFDISNDDLDSLEEQLRGEDHFQAIFQVGDLYEMGGTTHPGSLKLAKGPSTTPSKVETTLV